uniref:Survival protein SurE-like phosphatase/nucleotidase domain-containing protein n=1 Tax=Mycena chlorophos TaxID=658473 RepID=A0ABQ0LIP9_MYCCL|nr:predicted protein [Mycena chlorophos]
MLGHILVVISSVGLALAVPGARVLADRQAPAANKIVLANDDGWAVANIRAQFDALTEAGYDVVLSAPAENQSGKGSDSETPSVLTSECEYNTCPVGSPATGCNATSPNLCYVNAYPADAATYGISTFAPKLLGSAPDFVVSGPNVGSNIGLSAFFSGTIGAASASSLAGIPAAAFSADFGDQVSYTTLSNTSSPNTQAALLYSQLTVKFLNVLLASPAPGPILPSGVALDINYPAYSSACSTVDAFTWVLTRIFWDPFVDDVETCGSDHLPLESDVLGANGSCQISVSMFNPSDKLDASAAQQAVVLGKISSILSCAA